MQPIRALIAEDELLARQMLATLVARDQELELVGTASDGIELRELLAELTPDLALLDIQMPGADSFSALSQLAHLPVVIFITAHPEHAVRAFDLEAIDYVLKPFDDARFSRALARGKQAVRARARERIICRDGRDVIAFDQAEIDWIEACDYYAQIHAHGHTHLIREPLHELELRLDARFIRIHRSSIINLASLLKLETCEQGRAFVLLRDGTRLKVSRTRRSQLAARLGQR